MRGAAVVFLVAVLSSACVTLISGQLRIGMREINSALDDRRYMRTIFGCALGRTQCDYIGNEIKRRLPSLAAGRCWDCSRDEARQAKLVARKLRRIYPREYNELKRHYRG